MTLPTLVQNYKKQVVISKLQKASSILGQAYNMARIDYGNTRDDFERFDPEAAEEMLNKYYKPYMSVNKVEKGHIGAFAYLNDGTAIYLVRNMKGSDTWGNTYLVFCLTHKDCKEMDDTDYTTLRKSLGTVRFGLYTDGTIPSHILFNGTSRDELKENCKNGINIEACTALIGGDGWQIKDDYPFKF